MRHEACDHVVSVIGFKECDGGQHQLLVPWYCPEMISLTYTQTTSEGALTTEHPQPKDQVSDLHEEVWPCGDSGVLSG